MKQLHLVQLIAIICIIDQILCRGVLQSNFNELDLEETSLATPIPEQQYQKDEIVIHTGYEKWLEGGNRPNASDDIVHVQSGTQLDGLVVQAPPSSGTTTTAGTLLDNLVYPSANSTQQAPSSSSSSDTTTTTTATQSTDTDIEAQTGDPPSTVKDTDTGTTNVPPTTTTAEVTTQTTTTTTDTYGQLLDLSYMFYEAQQSGPLPPFNRIEWRGDSNVGDQGPDGEDLTGGWHDAGDHLKFVVTIAYTAHKLAWGFLEFKDGYSGYEKTALNNIKFAADFLIKCHIQAAAEGPDNKFVAQVGNVILDHGYWGRPEDMDMDRPAYVVDCASPGTEPAALSSAALSAVALIYAESDPDYAQESLAHAMQLYAFASKCKGKWTDSVVHEKSVYPSYALEDELALAAAWLYKVTAEEFYLTAAQTYWNEALTDSGSSENADWDNNFWSATILLWELDTKNKAIYEEKLVWYMERWVSPPTACPSGGDHSWGLCLTPGGLSFMAKWGALRHNMNAGFNAMLYAKKTKNNDALRCWTKSQMDYIVGGDFSYVVGYGSSYPQKPHHRSSSCESTGPCGQADYTKAEPNPQILYGALVGGPSHQDQYADNRDDYIQNEVAIDYNAGFTGVLAALREVALEC